MAATSRNWGVAWVALTAALALHVWDEAAHDFLSVYNPTVLSLRDRWPFLPLPTFTFRVWLTGLAIAVAALAALAPFAFRGRPWLKLVAYPYGILMLLNGIQHIAVSIARQKLMPGVISAPLLIVVSIMLLIQTRRAVPSVPGN